MLLSSILVHVRVHGFSNSYSLMFFIYFSRKHTDKKVLIFFSLVTLLCVPCLQHYVKI